MRCDRGWKWQNTMLSLIPWAGETISLESATGGCHRMSDFEGDHHSIGIENDRDEMK